MNSLSKKRTRWGQSLAIRLAAVWAIALGAAVGLSSWLSHRDAREQLLGNLQETVEQDTRVIQLRLGTWMRTFQDDARSTSQSPLLAAFLDARGTAQEPFWRNMAEAEFRAGFAGKPAYFQMRLLQIAGEDDGQELLRLDRQGDRLSVTPRNRLQKKSSRSYYQEALAAPNDSIYLSKVNLNRDFGGITEPHIPTIRAAVRITSNAGQQAMLIINADLRSLFAEIEKLSSLGTEVRLADPQGDFLLHPDPEATFATDLGHEQLPIEDSVKIGGIATQKEVPLGGWPTRRLTLHASLPETAWHAELQQSSRRGIWATAIASLVGASVAILIALPFTRRLGRLSHALREFDAKDRADPLPESESTQDEIGIALQRFREMTLKVRQHVDALQKARDEANEANAAKETFLAVMSHEIRTPMNAVVGLIRALEKNHPPAHQLPILTSLRSSTSNLMTLLNTALDYTRLREGAMEYASELFDAAQVVREVADSLTPSLLSKQLELQRSIPNSLLVHGDPIRFRQVVNNLLNNAIKFTVKGHVSVALHEDGDQIACTIADSGPGIAIEDQANIFKPFFTLSHSPENTISGAGLGLSVSRQMVEQQGGQMLLESQPGVGATFTARLPYALGTPPPGRKSMATPPRPSLQKGLRILYAEDVPSNQEVMALTLASAAVDLTCANTATEALALCERGTFDLIMVDLQLPDMAGDELARRILETKPSVPIIAVTAQSSARTDERIRSAGIKAVILKPFTEERVMEVISEHTTGSLTEACASIYPGSPERAAQLALSMATEFEAASDDLQRATQLHPWEASIHEIRAIRHKLTTALAQFSLTELQGTLDELIAAPDRDSALINQASHQMSEAAHALRKQSNGVVM